ncbi:MAG: DsbE family thiol:disulfide interchange protein [Rhodospirillaceae bacterium]|nr:DsbE family thiol:disulfide interchange protein [Rhodospirillaceae bacterium]
MGKTIFIVPFLISVGIFIYFAIPIVKKSDPRIIPSALLEKATPQHNLPPLLNTLPGIKKSDLKGEVRLVNFFSSWCGPCRMEHEILMRLSRRSDLSIYGINYKDMPSAAINWLNELGNPFTRIGMDPEGQVAIDWGVYGVPETYVVDRDGRIRHRHVGPLTERVLKQQINPLILTLRKP